MSASAAPKPRLKRLPRVKPRVTVDNQSSNRFTVIEVNGLDRIGLLYDVTEALFPPQPQHRLGARSPPSGRRTVDVFYVTDLTGHQDRQPDPPDANRGPSCWALL